MAYRKKILRKAIWAGFANFAGQKELQTYPEAAPDNYPTGYKAEWVQGMEDFLQEGTEKKFENQFYASNNQYNKFGRRAAAPFFPAGDLPNQKGSLKAKTFNIGKYIFRFSI